MNQCRSQNTIISDVKALRTCTVDIKKGKMSIKRQFVIFFFFLFLCCLMSIVVVFCCSFCFVRAFVVIVVRAIIIFIIIIAVEQRCRQIIRQKIKFYRQKISVGKERKKCTYYTYALRNMININFVLLFSYFVFFFAFDIYFGISFCMYATHIIGYSIWLCFDDIFSHFKLSCLWCFIHWILLI